MDKPKKAAPTDVRYFATPAALAKWFAAHHQKATEVWVGFYKTGTGKPSITWPQSVDEALRVGWIDGVRKSVDEERYVIRFTPRKKGSIWSQINLRKIAELQNKGLMLPAGEKIFAERDQKKVRRYSFEQEVKSDGVAFAKRLRDASEKAWAFFSQRPPGYRRTVEHLVTSPKKEETRERRFSALIASCERGELIPELVPRKGATSVKAGESAKKPEKKPSGAPKKKAAKASEKRPSEKKRSPARRG